MRAMTGPLPAWLIGGYLGAGKTTLLNHLLRHAGGLRIAVMVNDFGQIGLDADLIESRDGDVLNLAGGCICCSVGSDLIGALVALGQRPQPPDLVLVETSGVALPGVVARGMALVHSVVLQGIVVLADATSLRRLAANAYVGDTVLQQLHDADLLLLTKADLLDAPTRAALHPWLQTLALSARCIETVASALPVDLLLDSALHAQPHAQTLVQASRGLFGTGQPRPVSRWPDGPNQTDARQAHDSLSLRLPPGRVDVDALAAALADPALGLLRVKGIVQDLAGDWRLVQGVGARFQLTAAPDLARASAAADGGALVLIGLRPVFDADRLGRLVRSLTRS